MTKNWLKSICFSLMLLGSVVSAEPKSTTLTVNIQDMKFIPAHLEARIGDEIIWRNQDLVPHTVTSKKHKFASGAINGSKTWKLRVTQAGKFPYACDYHPMMQAEFVVKRSKQNLNAQMSKAKP